MLHRKYSVLLLFHVLVIMIYVLDLADVRDSGDDLHTLLEGPRKGGLLT